MTGKDQLLKFLIKKEATTFFRQPKMDGSINLELNVTFECLLLKPSSQALKKYQLEFSLLIHPSPSEWFYF